MPSLPPADLQLFAAPDHPRSDVVTSDRADVLWSEPAAAVPEPVTTGADTTCTPT